MRRVALVAAALAAAATPAAAQARGPINFNLTINRGAGGVKLDYRRATVIEKLGKPYYENANGYMQYSPDRADGIFDVYRNGGGKRTRVRMVSVSDRRFHFRGTEQRVVGRGVIPFLRRRYGRRLRSGMAETGEPYYFIRGRVNGRRTETSFSVSRLASNPTVSQVFILFV